MQTSRRSVLKALAAAPLALGQPRPRYDLLLRGGHVIDPASSLSGVRDVAIADGKVALVAESVPPEQAARTVDASGKVVTPGLIDVHVHVYEGVAGVGIWPDVACIARGSTTVLDGGSAGATTLPGFRRYVVDRAYTRVRALLNLSSLGLTSMQELSSLAYANVERALAAIEAHRDLVLGIKVRMTPQIDGGQDLKALELALTLASEAAVPLMVHIGGSPSPVDRLMDALRPGDVVTHAFRARGSIIDGQGRIFAGARRARERGVFFDIGHGRGNFSFDTAERALGDGFLPDTISSDLHAGNVDGPVHDLATTLSKFLHLGMSLEECVRAATSTPASIFALPPRLGALAEGAIADVAVFELVEGEHVLTDSGGATRTARRRLSPVATFKDGILYDPSKGRTL